MSIVIIVSLVVVFIAFDIFFIVLVFRNRRKKAKKLKDSVTTWWSKIEAISEPKWQILEIDKLIEEVMKMKGYHGSFGQKAKRFCKTEKVSAEALWYIHKKRNQIAHEIDFSPDEKESKKVLGLAKGILENLKLL